MQAAKKRGVLYGEQVFCTARKSAPDWEAVRIALEVARQGGFRAAAKQLDLSVDILRRRVRKLERLLGVPLMIRHGDQVRVTEEGEKIFAAASKMEEASYELLRLREQADVRVSGEVRLAVTEGLGTFWIAPRLIEFKRANPNLLVDVHCTMKPDDVLGLEADVAIQITRPMVLGLRRVKLGRFHLMPFASPDYLETFGEPKSIAELIQHRIVIQAIDNAQSRETYDRLFPGIAPSDLLTLRMNTSSTHYWAISKGAGIGFLPTYAQWVDPSLVPLDLGIHETMDIWLTYHPDARRIPRVACLIEWLIQSFSPAKCPWFRNEFVHPNEFMKQYRDEAPLAAAPDMLTALSA